MSKMRIYELAKQIEKDNAEILAVLKENGIEVKNHMSSIDDATVEIVKAAFAPKAEPKKEVAPKAENKANDKKPADKKPNENKFQDKKPNENKPQDNKANNKNNNNNNNNNNNKNKNANSLIVR